MLNAKSVHPDVTAEWWLWVTFSHGPFGALHLFVGVLDTLPGIVEHALVGIAEVATEGLLLLFCRFVPATR
jgi:hypothetical protein